MRGEVFIGQCHIVMAMLRVRAVSREAGVVPAQCFVTVRNYPGSVLRGPRGGGETGTADVDSHDGRRVAVVPCYPTLHGK